MTSYFLTVESPGYKKLTIRPNYDKLPFMSSHGSFALLPARVLALSYPSYLEMCRDRWGAELVGKGHMYVVPYFDSEPKELLKILNERMDLIMKERKNGKAN